MKSEEMFEKLWKKEEWSHAEKYQFGDIIKRTCRHWFLEGYDAGGDGHEIIELERLANEKLSGQLDKAVVHERELQQQIDGLECQKTMTIARLGGMVDGHSTSSVNFLQRIDALTKIEKLLIKEVKSLPKATLIRLRLEQILIGDSEG